MILLSKREIFQEWHFPPVDDLLLDALVANWCGPEQELSTVTTTSLLSSYNMYAGLHINIVVLTPQILLNLCLTLLSLA